MDVGNFLFESKNRKRSYTDVPHLATLNSPRKLGDILKARENYRVVGPDGVGFG
jgi:hypothetical protein